MTTYNFDETSDLHSFNSSKHGKYGEDVLGLWVADMDFTSSNAILKALHDRVDKGVFGYTREPAELKEVLCKRMLDLYGWEITTEDIVFVPGVVSAFNIAIRAYGQKDDKVLMQTPVYYPFLDAPQHFEQKVNNVDLTLNNSNGRMHYTIDFEAFETAMDEKTSIFLLCSPHNPVGRVWTKDELKQMADICIKHDLTILSDEIHCDLLLDGNKHIPTATLSPEIADKTITMMAPSKTFNVPGLGFAFAIIQNKDLREKYKKAMAGIVPHVNIFGYEGAMAAYDDPDSQVWLDEVLAYIQANRDFAVQYIEENMPEINVTYLEGTYLMWLDMRGILDDKAQDIEHVVNDFLLDNAKVALDNGRKFGEAGEGFVRLNLGCPRSTLVEALERIEEVVS